MKQITALEYNLKKARWYNERNRTYKACLHYQKALQSGVDDSVVLEELAMLYFERSDFSLAAVCFEELVNRSAKRQDLILKLAGCLFQTGEYFKGKMLLSRVRKWQKVHLEEAILSRAHFEQATGHPWSAIRLFCELIETSPQPMYYLYLAEAFENLDQYNYAVEICRRGLKREPYFEELIATKARMHLYLSQYDKAALLYQKMIRNQMYTVEAKLDLEEMLVKKGYAPEIQEILRYFDEPVWDLDM
jgi:tetratricopeptide (TPR) repeat protein